jgi:hypothetical protein
VLLNVFEFCICQKSQDGCHCTNQFEGQLFLKHFLNGPLQFFVLWKLNLTGTAGIICGQGYGFLILISKYFSFIVAVNFING